MDAVDTVEVYGAPGDVETSTPEYTPTDLGTGAPVSTAPPALSLPASASAHPSSGPFAAYGNLSGGWKVVYGLIAVGIFIWIAQTRYASLAVVLLVAGIIYEIVK